MWFDIVNLFIMLASCGISLFRGLIRELFGLIGIGVSLILFASYHGLFTEDFTEYFSPSVAGLLSASSVMIVLLLISSIIASWLSSIFDGLRFNAIDRFGGLLVGVAKGVLLSYVFLLLVQFFYMSTDNGANNSENASSEDEEEERVPDFLKNSVSYSMLKIFEEKYMGNFNEYAKVFIQDTVNEYKERRLSETKKHKM